MFGDTEVHLGGDQGLYFARQGDQRVGVRIIIVVLDGDNRRINDLLSLNQVLVGIAQRQQVLQGRKIIALDAVLVLVIASGVTDPFGSRNGERGKCFIYAQGIPAIVIDFNLVCIVGEDSVRLHFVSFFDWFKVEELGDKTTERIAGRVDLFPAQSVKPGRHQGFGGDSFGGSGDKVLEIHIDSVVVAHVINIHQSHSQRNTIAANNKNNFTRGKYGELR